MSFSNTASEDTTKVNREAWHRRTKLHLSSEFYDMAGFKTGRCSLNPIELELLGKVEARKLLHLQCHFGQDTLSLARMGAEATGVDFSQEAVAAAKSLSKELSIKANFVCSDVLELDLGERFDTVFTSYGVLSWLENLDVWADRVVAHLKPGGVFLLVEFHPTLMMYDFESRKLAYHYFRGRYREEVEGSYAAPDSEQTHLEYFWTFSLADIFSVLLARGLRVLDFQEYDYSPYGCFSGMVEEEPGQWRWESEVRFPHIFSLKMENGK